MRDPGKRPVSIIMDLDEPFNFFYEDIDNNDNDEDGSGNYVGSVDGFDDSGNEDDNNNNAAEAVIRSTCLKLIFCIEYSFSYFF